jgi:hypothetical protein
LVPGFRQVHTNLKTPCLLRGNRGQTSSEISRRRLWHTGSVPGFLLAIFLWWSNHCCVMFCVLTRLLYMKQNAFFTNLRAKDFVKVSAHRHRSDFFRQQYF